MVVKNRVTVKINPMLHDATLEFNSNVSDKSLNDVINGISDKSSNLYCLICDLEEEVDVKDVNRSSIDVKKHKEDGMVLYNAVASASFNMPIHNDDEVSALFKMLENLNRFNDRYHNYDMSNQRMLLHRLNGLVMSTLNDEYADVMVYQVDEEFYTDDAGRNVISENLKAPFDILAKMG